MGLSTKEWIEELKSISKEELAARIKIFEETFRVSAAVATGPVSLDVQAQETEAAEASSYTVSLTDPGDKKIQVIKVIRGVTQLGLKEAKALTDELPSVIKEELDKESAEKLKVELEEAGAKVELKGV